MPDISMCKNITCGKRETCYRFMAKPDTYQSYASFKPDDKGHCDYYYELPTRKIETKKRGEEGEEAWDR